MIMHTLILGIDLRRPHPPSLHRYTSPAMIKFIKCLSLSNLELETMPTYDDTVKILTYLLIMHTVKIRKDKV